MLNLIKIFLVLQILVGNLSSLALATEEKTQPSRTDALVASIKRSAPSSQSSILARLSDNPTSFPSYLESCHICLNGFRDNDKDLVVSGCRHRFHKACLYLALGTAIENGRFPVHCPGNGDAKGCTTRMSLGDIKSLEGPEENGKLCEAFLEGEVRLEKNLRLCPKCKAYVASSQNSCWVQRCENCKKTLCFTCGKNHQQGQSCFEVDTELSEITAQAYAAAKKANPTLIWKLCPNCGAPQEKQSGCNQMVCGIDTHGGSIKVGYGCGFKFDWMSARHYRPNQAQRDPVPLDLEGGGVGGDLEVIPAMEYQNHRPHLGEYNQRLNARRNGERILGAICCTWIAACLSSSAYCSIHCQFLADKNLSERNKYCHAEFENTDAFCMNLECLPANNMTIDDYLNCFDSTSCWNDGDNPFALCIDEKCENYKYLCENYKKYYDPDEVANNDLIYYENHDGNDYLWGAVLLAVPGPLATALVGRLSIDCLAFFGIFI